MVPPLSVDEQKFGRETFPFEAALLDQRDGAVILRLDVRVLVDRILIRYYPLLTREISLMEIDHFETRRYDALKEYGGWGIRGGSQKRAYNVYGKEGVELTLRDGSKVMIGSQKAIELEQSIGRVKDGSVSYFA